MNRIHKKSALAETSPLLLAAHDLGVPLSWDRLERQLPLCAFTSNGLSCRKCFQGPCRINPFGDEPSQGVCGADRDQMAMEALFQATLDGVLESARAVAALPGGDQELPDLAAGLPAAARTRLAAAGLLPVRKSDLLGVQNAFFSSKGYLAETLRDLTRLGLIHFGLLAQAAAVQAGGDGPAPDPRGLNLLILGQLPAELVQALERAGQKRGGQPVNLFLHGGLGRTGGPAAADLGSPELFLGMKLDALLLAPDAGRPGLEALAAKYGVPVILVEAGKPSEAIAAKAVDLAAHRAQNAFYGSAARTIQPAFTGSGAALEQAAAIRNALEAGRVRGVVVLFGEAGVKQTCFARTLALMDAALTEKALILVGGGLGTAADALAAELSRRQGDRLAAFAGELGPDGLQPIAPFGSAADLTRVVALLAALETGGRPVPAVAAFPEFYRASTWAAAVSLFCLGFTVQVGTRLPFWGSPWLAQTLPGEWRKLTGGTLLATPALPEAEAQAAELASSLRAEHRG